MHWHTAKGLTHYPEAVAFMETQVALIAAEEAPEQIWLVEHPPLYTAGTSAKAADLLQTQGFPVYETGRGGQYTYHGPGQRVVYVMCNLKQRGGDVRAYVQELEQWCINTLKAFDIEAFTREGRVGVWVQTPCGEEKIAAIGIRVRRGVTFHGMAINVNPDLSHYRGIVPCGLGQFGVTSLHALGKNVPMAEVDAALKATCPF